MNAVVRYTKSKMSDSNKGLFFRSRLSQTLPKNLKGSIWKAVSIFIEAYRDDEDVLFEALKPFSPFRKEPDDTPLERDPNKMLSAVIGIFSLRRLGSFLQDISWNSNLLDVDWNPQTVTGISTSAPSGEYVIWDGAKLTANSPYRFRRWVQKVLEPQKDPMALLLHVLNHIGVINASHFHKYDSIDFVLFRRTTPRYFELPLLIV